MGNPKKFSLEEIDNNLGVQVEETNAVRLSVGIVNYAIEHGFDIELEAWKEDVPVFLEGHPTHQMLSDLGYVADVAVVYLSDILPENYNFVTTDTELTLVKLA